MRLFFLAAVVVALVLSGCSEPGSGSFLSDDKNPWLKKAETEMQSRNYAGAAQFYEKALEQNPSSLATHWTIAMLYEQHLNDFASAIYHYQRVIALKPEPERVKTATAFILRAKYRLAAELPNTPVDGAVDIEATNKQIKSLQTEVEKLQQQLAEANLKLANQPERVAQAAPASLEPPTAPTRETLTDRVARGNTPITANTTAAPPVAAPPPETGAGQPVVAAVGSAPPPVATSKPKPLSPTKTQRHVVKRGETLSSIAEKYYGSRSNASVERIYKSNRSAIPDKNRLLVGTELTIPPRSSR